MINTSKEKNKYIKSQNKIHLPQAFKYNLAPKQKKLPLSTCICTPSFCDELSKGNHNSSLKGGGYGVDPLVLVKSARKV